MTAGPQIPSFEDILDQSALRPTDEVIARRSSPWEQGSEEIEKACAESPDVFSTRGSLPIDKLVAMYDDSPILQDDGAETRPLPGELALRLQQADLLSPDELRQLRRDLALWHHPDRHAPELQAVTGAVMKSVNAMIDEALRKRRTT